MKVQVLANAAAVAAAAARIIAREGRAAVAARRRFTFAVSGGKTPWRMLRALAREKVPWESMYVVQVDERVAPAGHPDRNLTQLRDSLLQRVPLPPDHVCAMPVNARDLKAAVETYALLLRRVAKPRAVIDLIHLGLGPDGHTASLTPGDPVLNITDTDVGLAEKYQGRRRMTLTYPVLNRARRILWVVTGAEKAEMLVRLRAGDPSIPAGRVSQDRAIILADRAAARLL